MTVDEWAEFARQVIMVGHGADADRVELAEVFRRHEREVRQRAMNDARGALMVQFEMLTESK